ncbi:unnamed protein product, partial [Prorocentrum cordatum]
DPSGNAQSSARRPPRRAALGRVLLPRLHLRRLGRRPRRLLDTPGSPGAGAGAAGGRPVCTEARPRQPHGDGLRHSRIQILPALRRSGQQRPQADVHHLPEPVLAGGARRAAAAVAAGPRTAPRRRVRLRRPSARPPAGFPCGRPEPARGSATGRRGAEAGPELLVLPRG